MPRKTRPSMPRSYTSGSGGNVSILYRNAVCISPIVAQSNPGLGIIKST